MNPTPPLGTHAAIPKPALDQVLGALRDAGYTLVGPKVADGAIVYGEITGIADLPVGWTAEQEAGRYRLRPGVPGRLFGFAVGPHAPKRYLYPSTATLFRTRRTA
ncbi:MAG: hypothetical protein QN137_04730, partial [Armatimonadota bacterium]|nr:hypothetical protein [Armatimonadota bacterium]